MNNIINDIKSNLFEILAIAISCIALIFSVASYFRGPQQHSDILTSDIIRDTYSDFLEMSDLRGQFPLQSHLFATPDTYQNVKRQVDEATETDKLDQKKVAKLHLQERAVADRLFTMFEHSFYQWRQANRQSDLAREEFLREVLDYFTDRLLRNPRLLWYWSPNGGNMLAHFESETINFYDVNIEPRDDDMDATGPFTINPAED
jgi:hypothetical protein